MASGILYRLNEGYDNVYVHSGANYIDLIYQGITLRRWEKESSEIYCYFEKYASMIISQAELEILETSLEFLS